MRTRAKNSLLFLTLLTLFIQLVLIQTADAAQPAPVTYTASPTTHTVTVLTGPFSVTDAAYAYDGNQATYAWLYSHKVGYFNIGNFSVSANPWRVYKVNIHIKYGADSSKDDSFRVLQYVVPSATEYVLQDWHAGAAKTDAVYSWYGRPEPNNGTWEWTDVSNIKVRFHTQHTGGTDSRIIRVYEVWAEVCYRAPALAIDPPSNTVAAPFTIWVNLTSMEDLYSWEFNITYDTTKLTATTAKEEPFMKNWAQGNGGNTQFNKTINDAQGWVWVYCSIVGNIPGASIPTAEVPSGSGDYYYVPQRLANITFNIDASGTGIPLNLHNSKLIEYDYLSMATYHYPPNHLTEADATVDASLPAPEFSLETAMIIALGATVLYVMWRGKLKSKNLQSAFQLPPENHS